VTEELLAGDFIRIPGKGIFLITNMEGYPKLGVKNLCTKKKQTLDVSKFRLRYWTQSRMFGLVLK